ncbi:S-layer homology domain-containing protein [Cohnella yongneupensis]|uniref:S-layer homology domain-containing protein n=1 Tax=Cohnella yongneupensis TaxID=425006 RepID=A0ABW0R373_9BACL
MYRKLITLLILTVLLSTPLTPLSTTPLSSAADNGTDSGLPSRSGEQIADMWAKLMHPKADFKKPYSVAPKTVKPYSAGALRADYIQDGVNAVNFYRFISGLPYDLKATAALNAQAQYGAVLLAATGYLTHTPKKISDMPDDFYKQGYDSTSSSNIYSSYGYDDHIVARSIDAYMEDSDVGNLDRVGHRRWILNPPLQEIGIGQAESADDTSFSALQVFDMNRKTKVDYHYIAYPAAGLFPIEAFGANYAWSVSINPDEFADPIKKNIQVTLKRQRDGKQWTIAPGSYNATVSGAYLNVENSYYGSGPAIIFRPEGVDAYRAGDKYEIAITGLKSTSGASKTVRYTVEFMSAEHYVPSAATTPATRFTDIAKHWAKASIEWAAGKGIVSDIKGPFRPEDDVKEEEMLKMLLASQGVPIPPPDDGEEWSTNYYDYATNNGYNLAGSTDQKLRHLPMDRQSVAELIAAAKGLNYTGDRAIQYLLDNGYSKGKTAATVAGYAGSDPLTRAEAVQFIRNLIEAGYTL